MRRVLRVPRLLLWGLFATLLISSSGIVCEPAGDTRLSSLELKVLSVNRIGFAPMLRVYDLWLPAGATQATVRAVPMDPEARVTWYVPDGAGMLASGNIGVGGGEVTVDLPPDGYALYIGVFPPEGAVNDYILNVNPTCPQGDACSNGNLFSSTCQSGSCSDTCVATGPELCDGRDNDCNGIPDDGIADLITGIDTGACEPEVQSCINGSFLITQFAVGPSPETCDGLDNDCNAQSDDGIADIVMGTNAGECQETIQSCVGGTLTVVQSGIGPSAEACDGLDNNCNGTTDDPPVCNLVNQVAVGLCPNYRCSNLDGEDLRQGSLDCADFTDASLRGANLAGVDLSLANFNGADLSDANLSGADVRHASFVGADLSFADLFGADIGTADFTGADLTGAR